MSSPDIETLKKCAIHMSVYWAVSRSLGALTDRRYIEWYCNEQFTHCYPGVLTMTEREIRYEIDIALRGLQKFGIIERHDVLFSCKYKR